MARLKLDKKSRKLLFEKLKEEHGNCTLEGLAKEIGVSFRTIKKWRYGPLLIPSKIIPVEMKKDLEILETKEDNWGQSKGGTKAWKKILKKYEEDTIRKWRQKGGKTGRKKLRIWLKVHPQKTYFLLRRKKFKKALKKIEKNTQKNNAFFQTNEIGLETGKTNFSDYDNKREIRLPKKLCPQLAEEIGIHIGDGTLSQKKFYFSVRGGLKEEEYYKEFILPLYEKLYNIKPPLLKRSSACGFEISSKAIYEFKNKVLGLPVGVKTYKVKAPNCILKSRNKNIITAFIRGLVDTDGCYYFRRQKYPIISLCVKSAELIKETAKMLVLLGFSPQVYSKGYTIYINGIPSFKKWVEEIGSHNPKHLKRIENIKNTLPWSSLEKLFTEESSSEDASLRSL